MNLNDKQREAAFPVHIELGREDDGRISYPLVDFGDAAAQLPDEGCALVHFKKTEDGLIEAHRICLAEGADDEGYAPDTLESVLGRAKRKTKTADESAE